MTTPLWSPPPDRIARANLTRFAARYLPGAEHARLWQWSVDHPEQFWPAVWEFGGVIAEEIAPGRLWEAVLEGGERMAPPDAVLGPRWFRGARLNFAENLLRFNDDKPALVSWNEQGRQRELSYRQLNAEVARWAAALAASGVGPGDRVAGFLPNIPEAVIAMLATATLGAVWSSCSPDFGERAVLDRFGQIRPAVLIAVDGYRYAGKEIDLSDRVRAVAAALTETRVIVVVPYLDQNAAVTAGPMVPLESWLDPRPPVQPSNRPSARSPRRFPFDHPLYIVYSSGTTGLPKCIVHGAGGTLLQHLKELQLHTDLIREDRIFYFTTCGWMMWNWLVSSLAVGATVVLYDGAPMAPAKDILWRLVGVERVTVFGTSASYLALCEKESLVPGASLDLSALRCILSTGSPLAVNSYDYVYRQKPDLHLASISGGTDILSCFALGNPTAPVWRGELQSRGLGMAVDVFGPDGASVIGQPGELVCTRPFPSMPVAFWDDPDGTKYRAAYFDHFPNTWRHGDWAERTDHDGLVIYGRSDATLNPGGVRIGTAEIYRQVEQLDEVLESLVVAQEWEDDVRVVLFVRLRDGLVLDDALRDRIRREIRAHASPHHVPRKIIQVTDLPRTINGKLSELAVRAVVHGRPVGNREALANPQALELFRDLAELAS
ncbi:MAG: acetoacetate--CoA ligase [Gemmatimonadota bacterium]|nr:acetoacetate--CoA ligase [Gemmatimonadota bacterium]